jgi:hypothetical protein
MTVLLENTGVYRGGAVVGRPRNCTARLHADRVEVLAADGGAVATFPLADIGSVKASGAALMLKGDSFKSASIEFMSTGRKMLLAILGVIPLLIAMYAGQGRKTAVAWKDRIEELRASPQTPSPGTGEVGGPPQG